MFESHSTLRRRMLAGVKVKSTFVMLERERDLEIALVAIREKI